MDKMVPEIIDYESAAPKGVGVPQVRGQGSIV